MCALACAILHARTCDCVYNVVFVCSHHISGGATRCCCDVGGKAGAMVRVVSGYVHDSFSKCVHKSIGNMACIGVENDRRSIVSSRSFSWCYRHMLPMDLFSTDACVRNRRPGGGTHGRVSITMQDHIFSSHANWNA